MPFEEQKQLRRDEAKWWIAKMRDQLRGAEEYESTRACPRCGDITPAVLVVVSNQNTVRCQVCGKHIYNAPKTETGQKPRTVATLRQGMKPSQQARVLERDGGRCILCHRNDVPLTVGHLISVKDGATLGLAPRELADDFNLAAMCESCNAGLGGRSVLPATYVRHVAATLRVAIGIRDGTTPAPLPRVSVGARADA